MHGARYDNVVCGLVGGVILEIRRGIESPFVHGRVKTANTSPQAIELYPRCSGQAHSKGSRTGIRNENMEDGCAFRIRCALSIIRPLSRADA